MVIWLCLISLTPLNPMQKSNRKSNYLLLCTSFLHSATTFKFISLAYLLFRNSLSKKFILPWCHRPTRPILCYSLIMAKEKANFMNFENSQKINKNSNINIFLSDDQQGDFTKLHYLHHSHYNTHLQTIFKSFQIIL